MAATLNLLCEIRGNAVLIADFPLGSSLVQQ